MLIFKLAPPNNRDMQLPPALPRGVPRCEGSTTCIDVLDTPALLWVCFSWANSMPRNDLQGSLDLLVLKTLSQTGALHGYGIVLHIQQASDNLLQVEEGSIYPALHRIENHGWVTSEWGSTETNRKAKYYKLTAAGRKELQEAERSFEQLVKGIRAVLRYV
jgi:PadR family transcriptional regulator, regulatory protein PadR